MRTSPRKFAHLAEKSEKGSISNLSTEVLAVASIGRGLIQDYNARNPTRAIQDDDLIIRVNGREGDQNLILDQILHKADLTILVERPSLEEIREWATHAVPE